MEEQAVATYYVLYRLAQMGFAAAPTSGDQAELMACTPDGRRVVLLRVRTRDGLRWNLRALDRRPAGRNVAYVFVTFDAGAAEPSAFILRGARVLALLDADPAWPRDGSAFAGALSSFDDARDAWHLLGLSGRSQVRSAGAVSSSPVL